MKNAIQEAESSKYIFVFQELQERWSRAYCAAVVFVCKWFVVGFAVVAHYSLKLKTWQVGFVDAARLAGELDYTLSASIRNKSHGTVETGTGQTVERLNVWVCVDHKWRRTPTTPHPRSRLWVLLCCQSPR